MNQGARRVVMAPACGSRRWRCSRCSSPWRSWRPAAAATTAPTRSANDAYANSVCTAIGTWENQVKSIATNLSGGISKASLQAAVTQAETATKTLATQVAAVPPPDTSEGQAAKQQVDQLSSSLTSTVDSAKSTAAQIPSNASAGTIAAALAGLAPQVKSLATTAQTTLSSLQDAGGSLASAFKNSSSCQSLGS